MVDDTRKNNCQVDKRIVSKACQFNHYTLFFYKALTSQHQISEGFKRQAVIEGAQRKSLWFRTQEYLIYDCQHSLIG